MKIDRLHHLSQMQMLCIDGSFVASLDVSVGSVIFKSVAKSFNILHYFVKFHNFKTKKKV